MQNINNNIKFKYKKVDSLVHGEVKEIRLIGEDKEHENEKHYFVFWLNHNDEHRSTHVNHKELFEWFKIDQAEFDKKFMEDPDAEDKLGI